MLFYGRFRGRIDLPEKFFVAHFLIRPQHLPYFIFGLAYAYVCKKTVKSRILVVLAAIPMSIIGGVIRQSIIYLSAHHIGPFMVEYRTHVLIGWSVFLVVLGAAIWGDRKIMAKSMEHRAEDGRQRAEGGEQRTEDRRQ